MHDRHIPKLMRKSTVTLQRSSGEAKRACACPRFTDKLHSRSLLF